MRTDGFTLIEAVVATAVLVTALGGVARLLVQSAQFAARARQSPVALAAAEAKLAQLSALAWTYDASGASVSDTSTDTTTSPARPGGTGLALSPATALDESIAGYVDHIAADGRLASPGTAGAFLRRWRIRPVPDTEGNAIAIRVCVWRSVAIVRGGRPEVCVGTARVRR